MSEALQRGTQSHYDAHPFIEGGSNRILWWREYLEELLPDEVIRDRLVVDVGSSVGEISRGLVDRGARLACLDLSLRSLERCREINPEAEIYHGSALELPFADESFDHAISIGVLHHTPDCRRGFRELARVTAPGGRVVVFLYNFWSVYHPIYRAFAPFRTRLPLEGVPRWMLHSLQPFARTHLGQTLDETQLRNLLGDKLWTPRATFHSVSQVRRWGREEGLEFIGRKRFYLGYANVIAFEKRGGPVPIHPAIELRCLNCGGRDYRETGAGHECTSCRNSYELSGGIVRCLRD